MRDSLRTPGAHLKGAESVSLLEVVETVAPGLALRVVFRISSLLAHPGTAIPRGSKYSRIFFNPSLMRPFTVPSGRSRSFAISVWVHPEK